MNQQSSMMNLVKLNENFPDKINFYMGVKENLEVNKDDYHKLVDKYMKMNLAVASHKLSLALLSERIGGFYLILEHDKKKQLEEEEESEAQMCQ